MIIVIGASSSIGIYLVDELVAQKRTVLATTRSKCRPEFYSEKGVAYQRVDVSKKSDFQKLPTQDIDAVILLAGLLPANFKEYASKYYDEYVNTNIQGTLNVLEYCRENKTKKIIFATSHSDVSGLWDCNRAITEEDPRTINYTGDHAVYIISKITAMDLIKHYHQEYGVEGISMRLPAVYAYSPRTGMYIGNKFVKAGFNIFIDKAITGEPIDIWGNAKIGKDIVYVKDVVSAFIGAVDSEKAHGLYNIATGICTTLEEEVRGIIEIFSSPDKRSKVYYKPEKQDTLSYLYDISKAERDLGYVVRYPFKKMLEDYKLEMNRQPSRFLLTRQRL